MTGNINNMECNTFVNVCGLWFRMEYFDDLASGQCAGDQPPLSGLAAIAVKNLHLTGVKAYCDEFPAARRKEPQCYMFSSESVSLSSFFSVSSLQCEQLYGNPLLFAAVHLSLSSVAR